MPRRVSTVPERSRRAFRSRSSTEVRLKERIMMPPAASRERAATPRLLCFIRAVRPVMTAPTRVARVRGMRGVPRAARRARG